jgi:hypothetical protein
MHQLTHVLMFSFGFSLIGFGICLASGIFFTVLSTLMLPLIVIKPHKFAVAYSIGNLLMMARYLVKIYALFRNTC